MTGLGLAILRLALAVVFVAHGSNTLFGAWAGPGIGPGGLDQTSALFINYGLNPAYPLAVFVGSVELAGGVLLAAGLWTRWAAVWLLATQIILAWKMSWPWGFFLNWTGAANHGQGIEFTWLVCAGLLCLLVAGAGEWSLDGRRAESEALRAAGRARLRGKM